MAIQIKSHAQDNTFSASKLVFPVEGARYLNVFGGNSAITGRNLALNNPTQPLVVGNPEVFTDYVVLESLVDFIDTKLLQPRSFTFVCVAAPLGDNDQATLISNAGSSGNPAANLLIDNGNVGDDVAQIKFGVALDDGSSPVPSTVTQPLVVDISEPSTFIAAYDDVARVKSLFDPKQGQITIQPPQLMPARIANTTLRVGSTVSSNAYPERVKMYFAGIWERSFSQEEVDITADWLKNFYSKRFGLNV